MSRVEDVLSKLGLEHRRQGERIWLQECPAPKHGRQNSSHEFQNAFVRAADPGLWFCFSCKGGGNLVELVMILRKVGYREARDWVREIASAETEAPFLRVRSEVARAPGAIDVPAGVEMMGAPLEEWNSVPREYLLSRGVTDEQVRRWKIGYSLMGRLEGRIFLPIFDAKGRLANYAARSFVGAEKRYLAAGTWEAPDKSALWGEHRWLAPEMRRVVFVVEGSMNGLALERALGVAGIEGELAGMSGIDVTAGGQLDVRTSMKLSTFRKVVVATDGDAPGERAAVMIARTLRRRCEVVRLDFPEGQDACDLSLDELVSRLKNAA